MKEEQDGEEDLGRQAVHTTYLLEKNAPNSQKNERKKFICKKCGFVAVIFNDLVQHYESVHLGIQYPCDQCDHISSTASGLKLHK